MSRYIATRALRGANLIVREFDDLLQKALAELGPDKEVHFPNTAYYLPTILGSVKLTGKSSHAAEPEKGNNPAMAISKIIQSLDRLIKDKKKFLEHTHLTVIHIRLGEIAFGTSPGYAEIRCTLRAFRNEDMDKLIAESEKVIQQISLENKLRCDITYSEEFPATENDAGCVEMVKMAAIEMALEVDEPDVPYPWSEDFAHYTGEYKACLFGLGSGITQSALHNPDYDFPDALIETGVRMFEKIYQKILL